MILRFANWPGWGPAKSWRRRLTPFALSALAGIALAVGRVDPSHAWPGLAIGIGAVAVVVAFGSLIHFGPFVKLDQ